MNIPHCINGIPGIKLPRPDQIMTYQTRLSWRCHHTQVRTLQFQDSFAERNGKHTDMTLRALQYQYQT